MTEAEWLVCTDPRPMLEFLRARRRRDARKAKLFSFSCWQRVWHLLDGPSRAATTAGEKLADGPRRLTTREFRIASKEAEAAVAFAAGRAINDRKRDRAAQVLLLRDIFGNPFRAVTHDPAWLAWNAGTIRKLAQTIYDERRFEDLPILADALEEAGCTNGDILDHCRGPGPHVRGCWVVDLILGKE